MMTPLRIRIFSLTPAPRDINIDQKYILAEKLKLDERYLP
jgi:hypothetical protein